MSNLVERYIYDVARRLPENERDEVRKELASNIADMLPDNPGEQDVAAVLTNLGAPSKLAMQYRQKPRYLISPALYDNYIIVLKKVMLVVALVMGGGTALTKMLYLQPTENIGRVITEAVSSAVSGAFEGVLAAAFWVTVGFVIAERHSTRKEKVWSVNELPEPPEKNDAILSRSGMLVSMALNVFFTGLVILMITRYDSLLIFSFKGTVIHPFSQAALDRSIPYILLLCGLSLVVSGVKFYYGHWCKPVCIVNILHNLIWTPVVIYMLHWPDLFNDGFVVFVDRTFTAEMDILSHFATGGTVMLISAVLILSAVMDSVSGIWKTYKGARP